MVSFLTHSGQLAFAAGTALHAPNEPFSLRRENRSSCPEVDHAASTLHSGGQPCCSLPSFLRLVCRRNMTAAHYKGGHPPGNDLGLHYTALPPIVASCPYSDQLLVTRKFWSPGANRPSQASTSCGVIGH